MKLLTWWSIFDDTSSLPSTAGIAGTILATPPLSSTTKLTLYPESSSGKRSILGWTLLHCGDDVQIYITVLIDGDFSSG